MGLDIGGAETHVLELSRALHAMGEEIIVASSGGVYVAELERCGIKHVKLPLHKKDPVSTIISYFGLRKLIKKEKIDIVHAHARIPAFICGLLHKKLHFRFVCSAHWVFYVNSLLKRISDWGEKTIAVSEDIKQYVIDNYGVFPDNISVTINGVDMEKFSKDTDCSDVAGELGLPDERLTVVYVSRMDADRSAVARMLACVAEPLKKKYPALQIVIVGGGDDFEGVKSIADASNASVGECFVHMVGARTDINKFIALGDVFVGVSRAVLEAMSASKPVVVAGNEGYIGILGDENMDVAVSTNFCCRGCEESSEELVLRDVCRLLDMTEDERAEMGEANRRIIEENYSAARMAKDCKAVYDSLYPYEYKKYSDIIFSGYYGFGNMGDDSLLTSIVKNIKDADPNVRVTALTKYPKKMTRKYGVKCVNRMNVFAVWREMKHAKLLVSGGGSLLQDNTSKKSLEYYIQIMKMAKRAGLRVMVYANGIGPLGSERSNKKVKDIISQVDAVSLREPLSYELLREIGLESSVLEKIKVTADPALTCSAASEARKLYLFEKYGIKHPEECFAVSLREWTDLHSWENVSREDFIEKMAEGIADIVKKTGKTPVFIPAQQSFDEKLCSEVRELAQKKTGGEYPILLGLVASEVIALIGDMSFILAMRLHMLIYASAAGVPAIGISYDPKVDAFFEYASQFALVPASGFRCEDLSAAAEKAVREREEICRAVKARSTELSALAQNDTLTALSLARKEK